MWINKTLTGSVDTQAASGATVRYTHTHTKLITVTAFHVPNCLCQSIECSDSTMSSSFSSPATQAAGGGGPVC